MARKRAARLRELRAVLSVGQRMELLSGPICDPPREFANESDRERAWREHRGELLQQCERIHRLRPAAWWRYECGPADRPQILKVGHVAGDRNHPQGYASPVMESELSALLRAGKAEPADMAKGAGLVADPRESLRQSS